MANKFNIWANFKLNDQATKALKDIGKAGASLSRQFSFIGKNAGTVMGNIGRLASPFVALGGAATVAGMTAMVKNTANYGDQIANMVERVGWGTKAFQEYAHVARFSDMTTEEFAGNLEKLTRNMGMLRAGSGSLLTSIQKVSPALAEQLKATKTNEEAFELMISAIQKVEDPAKKAYLANAAFGKSGLKMVQLANHGADGIAKLRKEAQDMGIVLSETAVNNSAAFNDALEQNSETLRGLSGTITTHILPVIIPMIESFNKWIMANRELIATKVGDFIKNLAQWLKQVDFKSIGDGLANIIGALGSFIGFISSSKWALIGFITLLNIQTVGALINVITGIGKFTIMIPGFISALKSAGVVLQSLGGAFLKLGAVLKPLGAAFIKLGLAILTTPIGWIALGIAGIVAAFALLWNKCEGFRNFWIRLWSGIKSAFKTVADFIIGMIDAILNPIETLMKGINAVKNAGGWIADKLGFGDDEDETDHKSKENSQGYKNQPDEDIGYYPSYQHQKQYIAQTLPQTYTPYPQATGQTQSHSEVVVKFDNLPKEASVEKVSKDNNTDLGVEYGYALGGA